MQLLQEYFSCLTGAYQYDVYLDVRRGINDREITLELIGDAGTTGPLTINPGPVEIFDDRYNIITFSVSQIIALSVDGTC